MKKIILAITGLDLVTNATMIRPMIKHSGATIYTHHNPEFNFTGGGAIEANFDLWIDFISEEGNKESVKSGRDRGSIGILEREHKYVSFKRTSKHEQLISLKRLLRRKFAESDSGDNHILTDFIVPECYVSFGSTRKVRDTFNYAVPESYSQYENHRMVVKACDGSVGAEQALVPQHQILQFIRTAAVVDAKTLMEKFPLATFTKPGGNPTDPFFINGDLIVQEYIQNIQSEYRVLVSSDSFYIRRREIKPGDYPQANLEFDDQIVYKSIDPVLYQPLSEFIKQYSEELSASIAGETSGKIDRLKVLPNVLNMIVENGQLSIGSIDLFETESKFGVFEYCHQYGFRQAAPGFIQSLHERFVYSELTKAGLI